MGQCAFCADGQHGRCDVAHAGVLGSLLGISFESCGCYDTTPGWHRAVADVEAARR